MVLAFELSLDSVLQRLVELAVDLTRAKYGELGVISSDGQSIDESLTVGITPEQRLRLPSSRPALLVAGGPGLWAHAD